MSEQLAELKIALAERTNYLRARLSRTKQLFPLLREFHASGGDSFITADLHDIIRRLEDFCITLSEVNNDLAELAREQVEIIRNALVKTPN